MHGCGEFPIDERMFSSLEFMARLARLAVRLQITVN